MTPYLVRLLCMALAVFFTVHTVTGAAVVAVTGAISRATRRLHPRAAARLLLGVRILPVALASLIVMALCVPSYLLLEQTGQAEDVGPLCLALAVLGGALWLTAVTRGLRAAVLSARHARVWRLTGTFRQLRGTATPICLVRSERPILALAGLFPGKLVVSQGVAETLSGDQLDAALRHEEAHRLHHDNFKRLLLLLSPGMLPGLHGFQKLERAWFRCTEWAADDEAVSGNPEISISLAAALVRIARMGGAPAPVPLSATLLADGGDLSARVERLLRAHTDRRAAAWPRWLGTALGLAAAGFAATALQPVMLESAHRALELLMH